MAREILHGHFFAFYWGRELRRHGGLRGGGGLRVVRKLGIHSWALLPSFSAPVPWSLLWQSRKPHVPRPVGAVAAIAFWVWPEPYLTYYHHGDGFRWVVLLCGLTVFLTVLRIGDGEGTRDRLGRARAGRRSGMVVQPRDRLLPRPGDGLPARTNSPAAVRLAGRVAVAPAWVASILGSLPWWWHNFSHHFDSLRRVAQPAPPGPGGAYWWHLGIFERYVVPLVLGLRLRGGGQWLAPAALTSASCERRGPGARRVARLSGAHGDGPCCWWPTSRLSRFSTRLSPTPGIGKTGAMRSSSPRRSPSSWPRSCAGSERGLARNRRLAPGALAALVLVGGVGLTSRGRRCHLAPYKSDAALPGRRAYELVFLARQPEQLAHGPRGRAGSVGCPLRLFELLARLRRRVLISRPRHGEPCGDHLHPLPTLLPGDSGK